MSTSYERTGRRLRRDADRARADTAEARGSGADRAVVRIAQRAAAASRVHRNSVPRTT